MVMGQNGGVSSHTLVGTDTVETQQLFIWSRPEEFFSDEIKEQFHTSLEQEKSFSKTLFSLLEDPGFKKALNQHIQKAIFPYPKEDSTISPNYVFKNLEEVIHLRIPKEELEKRITEMYATFLEKEYPELYRLKLQALETIAGKGINHDEQLRKIDAGTLTQLLGKAICERLLGKKVEIRISVADREHLIDLLNIPIFSSVEKVVYFLAKTSNNLSKKHKDNLLSLLKAEDMGDVETKEGVYKYILQYGLRSLLEKLKYTTHTLRTRTINRQDLSYYLHHTMKGRNITREDIDEIDRQIDLLTYHIKAPPPTVKVNKKKLEAPQKKEDKTTTGDQEGKPIINPKENEALPPTMQDTFWKQVMEPGEKLFPQNFKKWIDTFNKESDIGKKLNTFAQDDKDHLYKRMLEREEDIIIYYTAILNQEKKLMDTNTASIFFQSLLSNLYIK